MVFRTTGTLTKICFLSSAHPKFDKRVFKKQAAWLARAGHDVTHICPDDTAYEDTAEGVQIKTYTRRGGLVGRVLNAPRLFRRARAEKADALHANELDSWLVALMVKATSRTKVVFDVHEFYPSMFAETRMPGALAPVASGAFRLLYRVLGPVTDLIVLANRHIRRDFPKGASNIINVENFGVIGDVPDTERPARAPDAPFVLIHVGLMAAERGSVVIPDAFEKLDPAQFKTRMIGRMADMDNDTYRAKIAERGLDDRVGVVDWLPFEQLAGELAAADAGFVFFQSGSETNAFGLPHKLFDYMTAGLPVLVSQYAQYVSEIVREADCGVILDSEDPGAVVAALKALAADPEEARRLGRNGQRALKERFNWEQEIARLSAYYDGLAA